MVTTKARQSFVVPVGAKGRLVLPADVRQRMGLREGDQVVLDVLGDDVVQLTSLRSAAEHAMGIYASVARGISLADELSEERRRDAELE